MISSLFKNSNTKIIFDGIHATTWIWKYYWKDCALCNIEMKGIVFYPPKFDLFQTNFFCWSLLIPSLVRQKTILFIPLLCTFSNESINFRWVGRISFLEYIFCKILNHNIFSFHWSSLVFHRSMTWQNKLQKLEDALDEQMLTWLIRLTGLIGLTMCKWLKCENCVKWVICINCVNCVKCVKFVKCVKMWKLL